MDDSQNTQIKNSKYKTSTNLRKPWLSGLAGFFFFGLGHFYSGEFKKGILIFIISNLSLTIFCFVSYIYFPDGINVFLYVIFVISLYIFIVSDSVRTAKKKGAHYILKKFNKGYLYILFMILSGLFWEARDTIVYEYYNIPTGSMENTLLVGDMVWASNLEYGIHIPFTNEYLFKYKDPQRNDIIVFTGSNEAYDLNEPNYLHTKRCVAVAGDTVQIIDKVLYINGKITPKPLYAYDDKIKRDENFINPRLFPKDSEWNEDRYGPIVVPNKGYRINFNIEDFTNWKKLIISEGHSAELRSSGKIYIDGKELKDREYEIENDYLFVMGDNRNNSMDSRFWGYLPYNHVLGKIFIVTWSRDPSIPLLFSIINLEGFRIDRIGKKVY